LAELIQKFLFAVNHDLVEDLYTMVFSMTSNSIRARGSKENNFKEFCKFWYAPKDQWA